MDMTTMISLSHSHSVRVYTFELDQFGTPAIFDSQPSYRPGHLHRRVRLCVLYMDLHVFRIGGQSRLC